MLEKTTSVSSREKEEDAATTTDYSIGSPLTDAEKGVEQNYMMARTTWMRMVSMKLDPDGKPVILHGGEVGENGRFVGNLWGKKTGATSGMSPHIYNEKEYSSQAEVEAAIAIDPTGIFTPGEPISTPEKLQHGRYWAAGESQPFRPSPGLKDIRVEHRSMRQAAIAPTRTTEINWICWTWQDLDRLIKHFLTPTAGVFVDWGWMGGKGTELYNVEAYPLFEYDDDGNITNWNFNVNKIENCLSMHIVDQKGHYDAIIGQVYNFDWKVRDDGGFDCTTQIIGKGSLILDTLNTIGTDHLKARLPNIIKSHDEETYYKETFIDVKASRDNMYSALNKHVVRWIDEALWILPYFAAEDFFKDPKNRVGYEGVFPKLSQAKNKALAFRTDPDGGEHLRGTGTETRLDDESTKYRVITHKETKGKRPIGNDPSLGALGISVIETPIEPSDVYNGITGGTTRTTTSRKFLYVKSPELLRALSPWITFDDYMNDMWNQVFQQMTRNVDFISSGNVIGIFGNESQHIYVTWGWFEDNVLSRFFGQIKTVGTDGGVIETGNFTEFRSYEDVIAGDADGASVGSALKQVGEKGKNILYDTTGDGNPDVAMAPDKSYWKCNASGIAYGDPIDPPESDGSTKKESGKKLCMTPAGQYVITTDTSKFLIVDEGSMTAGWVRDNWGTGWNADGGRLGSIRYSNEHIKDMLAKNNHLLKEHFSYSARGGAYFASTPFGKVAAGKIPDKSKINLKYFQDPNNPTEKDAKKSGIIRNVYFNVEFLREIMTEQPSIGTAVQNVWQEFSNEYGGIFRFGLEYSSTGGRTMVKSKTWTEGSVVGMLSNKSHRMDPNAPDKTPESVDNFDGLFEFPTWKAGSMVKSQNLAATLPSALKKQLSLQISNPNPEDVERSDDPQKVNESKGMIRLSIPDYKSPGPVGSNRSNYTKDDSKQEVMFDALSGTVDFPYRNNRWYGSNSADITTPLSIGKSGEGIQITGTLLESLINHEAYKYFNIINEEGEDDKDAAGDRIGVSAAAKEISEQKDKLMTKFLTDIETSKGLPIRHSKFYDKITADSGEKAERVWRGTYWKLNSDVRGALNGLLKGDGGPAGQEDPLIPIDFDMDIDGIGGIFPGNAFASNYLPTRYREQSCFQTTGVEQRVDSSNWTTTVKGQIRVTLKKDWNSGITVDDSFSGQGSNPFSGMRLKLPSLPEDPTNWDDFMLVDMELDELPPLEDYSKLEEPPPPPEPVVDSTAVGTIDGKDATQAEIDAAMAAARETLSAKEVESMTRAQAVQIFQDTLLSTLPAEFGWDTFVPVFEAIEDSAAAVGNPAQNGFARMDMNKALNNLYGITGIRVGTVTVDGITRTAYQISFSNGQRTVGP